MRNVGERREPDGPAHIPLKDEPSLSDGFDMGFPADQEDIVPSCKHASKGASKSSGTEDTDAHVLRSRMRGYL